MSLIDSATIDASDVIFVIANIGDYHAARLVNLSRLLATRGKRLLIVELRSKSLFYEHRQPRSATLRRHLAVTTIVGGGGSVSASLFRILCRSKAQHVVQIGYSEGYSILVLLIGRLLGKKVVFLADSKIDDGPRVGWKEWMKRCVLPLFDGAFVAGERHKRYFSELGVPAGRIGIGYDVVDNRFIAARVERYRRKEALIRRLSILPPRYVLVVSRLVPRKRVDLAIDLYIQAKLDQEGVDLVIIGDGPGASALDERIKKAGLDGRIHRVRDVPNPAMSLYYAFAEALLLVSEYDQWGLCVNEAMVAGVPAFVTQRCGCAGEIVHHGHNGFVWDGDSQAIEAVAESLRKIITDKALHQKWSAACTETMKSWDLDRFSDGLLRVLRL